MPAELCRDLDVAHVFVLETLVEEAGRDRAATGLGLPHDVFEAHVAARRAAAFPRHLTIAPTGLSRRSRVAVLARRLDQAALSFRPIDRKPMPGGSSYASQDSLALTFGMGNARLGQVDILWPGGVRNRLYRMKRFEDLVIPEIPCSITGSWRNQGRFVRCVTKSLRDLRKAGVVDARQAVRRLLSSIRAYKGALARIAV